MVTVIGANDSHSTPATMQHRSSLTTADVVRASTADAHVENSHVAGSHTTLVSPCEAAADVAELVDRNAPGSCAIVGGIGEVVPSLPAKPLAIPTIPAAPVYEVIKRAIDVCAALVGIVLASPLLLLCAILIKLQDGGPVLFRQERVGRSGQRFLIVKFRSMVVNAEAMKSELMDLNEHDDDRTFKILHDPRITRVGRFMRRMSLDELPQLWNILWGEMSLVGPRPALPSEVALYEPQHMTRLAVKPGLTCIWQVSGRSNLGFPKQMELDLQYIKRRSVWLDLMLIARTAPAVLFGEGAA
jgi:exopolysaccharide biosynthesis polyprenyl glycosylphosphotransferase